DKKPKTYTPRLLGKLKALADFCKDNTLLFAYNEFLQLASARKVDLSSLNYEQPKSTTDFDAATIGKFAESLINQDLYIKNLHFDFNTVNDYLLHTAYYLSATIQGLVEQQKQNIDCSNQIAHFSQLLITVCRRAEENRKDES